jgi:tRNA(fMet)-specific endonuclease VapC
VLDTNILVYWLRGKAAGQTLRASYGLGTRRPRPVVPVVVKGEIRSLALRLGWGEAKLALLDALLGDLLTLDISSDEVLTAYAHIDAMSCARGRRMGKNDLWIAAIALVLGAVILTTDADFDHLHPIVRVERVLVDTLHDGGAAEP